MRSIGALLSQLSPAERIMQYGGTEPMARCTLYHSDLYRFDRAGVFHDNGSAVQCATAHSGDGLPDCGWNHLRTQHS